MYPHMYPTPAAALSLLTGNNLTKITRYPQLRRKAMPLSHTHIYSPTRSITQKLSIPLCSKNAERHIILNTFLPSFYFFRVGSCSPSLTNARRQIKTRLADMYAPLEARRQKKAPETVPIRKENKARFHLCTQHVHTVRNPDSSQNIPPYFPTPIIALKHTRSHTHNYV